MAASRAAIALRLPFAILFSRAVATESVSFARP